jgi:hypothetical protein
MQHIRYLIVTQPMVRTLLTHIAPTLTFFLSTWNITCTVLKVPNTFSFLVCGVWWIFTTISYLFLFATFNGMNKVRKHFGGAVFTTPQKWRGEAVLQIPILFQEECLALNYLRALMHYFLFQIFELGFRRLLDFYTKWKGKIWDLRFSWWWLWRVDLLGCFAV